MAGIGFELKRVIEKGGMFSFLKAAFSGVMIVAGPWLISILSIYTISRLAVFLPAVEQQLFIAVIVYSYAFSLILYGGIHFIFTRIIADCIYEKKEKTASALLLLFLLATGVVSIGIGGTVLLLSGIETAYPALLFFGGASVFGSVSCIWIVMLFVSLVRWYGKILLSYLGGMGAAVGLMFLFARSYGIAGALIGFGAGQWMIAAALLFLSLKGYPAARLGTGKERIGPYIKKYAALFFTGQVYSLGIWIDKIIFWFSSGTRIGTTIFRLFPSYDIAVYIGTLTMIPGLVFFVVEVEPSIYVRLKKFLLSLNIAKLREIQRLKYGMLRHMRLSLGRLNLFGGVVAAAVLLLIPLLAKIVPFVSWNHFLLTFLAVFFHYCFLSYMNILFYLNFYRITFIAGLLFAGINTAVSLGAGLLDLTWLAGAGYLLGGAVAAVYSYIMLFREGKKIDRYIIGGGTLES